MDDSFKLLCEPLGILMKTSEGFSIFFNRTPDRYGTTQSPVP